MMGPEYNSSPAPWLTRRAGALGHWRKAAEGMRTEGDFFFEADTV